MQKMCAEMRIIMNKHIDDNCIFCKLANGDIPTNTLYEDDCVRVIFDAEPAAEGHVLILPKEHFDNIYELDDDTAGHVFKVAKKIATAMNKTLDMDGLNVVQNNGEAAGQTVFHFHMHIIPRHNDDTVNVGWEKHKVSSERIKDITDEVRKYL
jgi:histidine triad (HIT) family protein